jgi:Tfp pilus assembly ATPase PilU
MAKYCLSKCSILELVELLQREWAERIYLEVGSQPSLIVKGQAFEIDGPVVDVEAALALIRAVADTRQMRTFWKSSCVNILSKTSTPPVLIRVIGAIGHLSIELQPVKN